MIFMFGFCACAQSVVPNCEITAEKLKLSDAARNSFIKNCERDYRNSRPNAESESNDLDSIPLRVFDAARFRNFAGFRDDKDVRRGAKVSLTNKPCENENLLPEKRMESRKALYTDELSLEKEGCYYIKPESVTLFRSQPTVT